METSCSAPKSGVLQIYYPGYTRRLNKQGRLYNQPHHTKHLQNGMTEPERISSKWPPPSKCLKKVRRDSKVCKWNFPAVFNTAYRAFSELTTYYLTTFITPSASLYPTTLPYLMNELLSHTLILLPIITLYTWTTFPYQKSPDAEFSFRIKPEHPHLAFTAIPALNTFYCDCRCAF